MNRFKIEILCSEADFSKNHPQTRFSNDLYKNILFILKGSFHATTAMTRVKHFWRRIARTLRIFVALFATQRIAMMERSNGIGSRWLWKAVVVRLRRVKPMETVAMPMRRMKSWFLGQFSFSLFSTFFKV